MASKNIESRRAASRKYIANNIERVRESKRESAKRCRANLTEEERIAKRDKERLREQLYYQKYPEKLEKKLREKRSRRYSLTADEYDIMVLASDAKCQLCGVTPKETKLAIDHCHVTGKVRGVLCFACNASIGKLGDNSEGLLRAVQYLLDFERKVQNEELDPNDLEHLLR